MLQVNVFNGNEFVVASAPYGSVLDVHVDVFGTAAPHYETATGKVGITDSLVSLGNFSLNSDGFTAISSPQFNFPGNQPTVATLPAFAVGAHSFIAAFPGDPSFGSSTSTAVPFTVTQATTFPAISGPSTTTPSTPISLTVFVDTTSNPIGTAGSLGNAPTGTVTFFNGATQVGRPVPVTATFDSNGFAAAQATMSVTLASSASLTAKYSGDANYLTSTSPAFSVTVNGAADFTLTNTPPNPNPVTIAAPGQSGSSIITVSSLNGFTGTVTLSCSVSPQNLSDPPTCSMSAPGNVVLTNATTSGTGTVTMFTTAASSLWIKPVDSPRQPFGLPWIGALATVLYAALLLIRFTSTRKRFGFTVIALVLLTTGFALVGCGGGGGGGGGGNPGTTPSAYTVTVTAMSGNTSHSAQVVFNLQ
jgi:hypothetical protein